MAASEELIRRRNGILKSIRLRIKENNRNKRILNMLSCEILSDIVYGRMARG